MATPMVQSGTPAAPSGGFFGHPRGLATLFFTEFWERFTYYGIRGLLTLFMTADVAKGGFGFSTPRATAIYGLYTGAAYLACLPGGWLADRLLGQRRAVFLGGCIIALGDFLLVVHNTTTFYCGLILVITGTGLLKPNVSTMVGELYPEGGVRRDAGFSIFYSGINLGAFLAPLVCGWLGERVDWHAGFAAAGVGMVLGLIQYALGGRYLGAAGVRPNAGLDPQSRRRALILLATGIGLVVLIAVLNSAGVLGLTAERAANGAALAILLTAFAYFAFQLAWGGLSAEERKRMMVIFVLFLFATCFWSGFEQAGTSLNLFARDLTNRVVLGWEMPVNFLQSVNPVFIIIFAPIFAWYWQRLGPRNPSSPAKFSMGLIFLGLGFLVLTLASLRAIGHAVFGPGVPVYKVSPNWLVLTYLFHTFGELCLSPVGLSSVTKLAPHRKVSQMMGIWFMSISLGNVTGGLIAGNYEKLPLYAVFGAVAATTVGAGLILLFFVKPLRRMIGSAQ
jgi:POT family proton-dependent oligopeptide transporter